MRRQPEERRRTKANAGSRRDKKAPSRERTPQKKQKGEGNATACKEHCEMRLDASGMAEHGKGNGRIGETDAQKIETSKNEKA